MFPDGSTNVYVAGEPPRVRVYCSKPTCGSKVVFVASCWVKPRLFPSGRPICTSDPVTVRLVYPQFALEGTLEIQPGPNSASTSDAWRVLNDRASPRPNADTSLCPTIRLPVNRFTLPGPTLAEAAHPRFRSNVTLTGSDVVDGPVN